MGGGLSQQVIEAVSNEYYEFATRQKCILPDVGIDESLLKYSGTDSNAVLQAYTSELLDSVPGYIEKLGPAVGAMTVFPNAVGLGALVLSMILELTAKKTKDPTEDTYSIIRRVFGDEKASDVRDTMTEYVKRHRISMHNDQELLQELGRLEEQLSNQLSKLRNSLVHDKLMNARGFKIWVNGASFHIQMLIHEARLLKVGGEGDDVLAGKLSSIRALIGVYLERLAGMLALLKSHLVSSTSTKLQQSLSMGIPPRVCTLINADVPCEAHMIYQRHIVRTCGYPEVSTAYVGVVFAKHKALLDLQGHFADFQNNLETLVDQHDAFTLPATK